MLWATLGLAAALNCALAALVCASTRRAPGLGCPRYEIVTIWGRQGVRAAMPVKWIGHRHRSMVVEALMYA
jgi:hypothetical protein